MANKHEIPQEEGDFNREAVKKGLSPEEESLLKEDLNAVERGQGSAESITTGGADESSPDEFLVRQRASDEKSEREQEERAENEDSFTKFIRAQGVTEGELSDEIISGWLWNGDLGSFSGDEEPEERKTKLETLHRQWEEKKK